MNLASVLAIKISHAKEMKALCSKSKSKLNSFYSLSVKGVIEAINYITEDLFQQNQHQTGVLSSPKVMI